MLTFKEYVRAQSPEQAYEWNQKKTNRVIGGMMWVRLGSGTANKVIDLSGLGLDKIEETEDEYSVGAMVTLRQLELYPELDTFTQGAIRNSLRHIVGVQFRNLATVGGSIYGRFGFSDVLTLFLALDSYVELYRGGILPMAEFAQRKPDRDILLRVIIKKRPLRVVYLSQRNTKTDFPVLTCAVSCQEGEWKAAIGARPGRAVLFKDEQRLLSRHLSSAEIDRFSEYIQKKLTTGSNMRGSAEYRKHLAGVLVKRACMQIGGHDEGTVYPE